MRKQIAIDSLLIRVSIVLYVVSITMAQTITYVFGGVVTISLRIIALLFLLVIFLKKINSSKKERASIKKNKYPFIMVIMFLPFLWNNALFADGRWQDIADYVLAFVYAAIMALIDLRSREKRMYLTAFIAFGIVTSLFTWLQVISADSYYGVVKHLFRPSTIKENMSFYEDGNLFGLTSHYSGNAFYIVISVIFTFFAYKDKRKYILLLFFIATLLAIGKRGHLLFLIISSILAFLIIKRVSIINILKLLLASLVVFGCLFLASLKIPQIRHTIERAEESASSDDMTTGRKDMYKDAKRLYEENGYIPIGWGQYASQTNYFHNALHNDYLQLYYEVGLIGELLIVLPNVLFLAYSIKGSRKGDKFTCIVLVYNIFFMTYSLTGTPHYSPQVYFVYYTLNSIMFARLAKKGINKNEDKHLKIGRAHV